MQREDQAARKYSLSHDDSRQASLLWADSEPIDRLRSRRHFADVVLTF